MKYISIIACVIILFCSCSSSSKLKSSHRSTTDSTGVTVKNNAAKIETIVFAEQNNDTSSTITEEVEVKFAPPSATDSTEKENDYEGAAPKKKYTYTVDDFLITTEQPAIAVKVKRTGKTQSSTQKKEEKKLVTQTTSKDSTAAAVVKTDNSTSAEKKTKRVPWLQLFLIAVITTAAFYAYYKVNPFAGLLKRQKNEETG